MQPYRIYWILAGSSNNGSSRIHGYNIHYKLLQLNYYSKILFEKNEHVYSKPRLKTKEKIWLLSNLRKGDILFLQKIKDSSLDKTLFLLKLKGIKLVLVDCDIPICPISNLKYFNAVVCSSMKLKKRYEEAGVVKNITYIPDAVEYIFSEKKVIQNKKAVCFGNVNNTRYNSIKGIKQILQENDSVSGWTIDIVSSKSEWADLTILDWKDKRTYMLLSKYAVSLIPIDTRKKSQFKSSNRALQSMGLGLVVMCGDLESYREVVQNNVNGFICTSKEDWINAFKEIGNLEKMNAIVKAGFETAQLYIIDKIIKDWISLIKAL